MYLRAGTAGAGVPHLPEVVLAGAVDDTILRGVLQPVASRLVVTAQPLLGTAAEDGHVESILGQLEALREEGPGKLNRLALEVVAKGPVAQHLKHGVVVGIASYLLEVVVLAADAEALLRVCRTTILRLFVA